MSFPDNPISNEGGIAVLKGSPEVLVEVPEPVVQTLTEAPVGNKSLDEMTKLELEALGRTHGVELDRRKNKQTLVEKVKTLID